MEEKSRIPMFKDSKVYCKCSCITKIFLISYRKYILGAGSEIAGSEITGL